MSGAVTVYDGEGKVVRVIERPFVPMRCRKHGKVGCARCAFTATLFVKKGAATGWRLT